MYIYIYISSSICRWDKLRIGKETLPGTSNQPSIHPSIGLREIYTGNHGFFTLKYGGFPENVPVNQPNDIIMFYTIFSGWWFQSFRKIWVNGKEIKNGWNHQPVLYQYLKHLNIWADRSTHIFQWSLVSVKMTVLQSNIKRTFSNYTQLEILWTNYSREYNFQIQSIPKTCWIWLRMFHREGPSPRMDHWEHAKGLLQIFRINAVSC